MYSGLFNGLQPNNLLPPYYTTPAYNFGTFLFAPTSFDNPPLFAINSYYSQPAQPKIEQPFVEPQRPDEASRSRQRDSKKQRGNSGLQFPSRKKKTSKKSKTKKNSQKDDRNVISNLLKIFFKNLLDLQKWDESIRSLIQRQQMTTTKKRFYEWVAGFQINYRNYIKGKDIVSILAAQNAQTHQMLFRTLLWRFLHTQGVSHSLTARRIDKGAVRRHVQGLRQIELLLMSKQP